MYCLNVIFGWENELIKLCSILPCFCKPFVLFHFAVYLHLLSFVVTFNNILHNWTGNVETNNVLSVSLWLLTMFQKGIWKALVEFLQNFNEEGKHFGIIRNDWYDTILQNTLIHGHLHQSEQSYFFSLFMAFSHDLGNQVFPFGMVQLAKRQTTHWKSKFKHLRTPVKSGAALCLGANKAIENSFHHLLHLINIDVVIIPFKTFITIFCPCWLSFLIHSTRGHMRSCLG